MSGVDERAEYLRRVPRALASFDGRPLAYAMMSSHVHWAVWSGWDADSRFVHPLHVGFAGWLNRMHGRTGPVFGNRFTSVVCDAERAAVLVAYQHNNPVRAGLVADPADCDWTSHRAFLGLAAPPPWLDVERALSLCGFDASQSGRLAFHSFVLSRAVDPRDPLLTGADAEETRRRARQIVGAPAEVSDGLVAGAASDHERLIVVRRDGVMRPRWPGDAIDVARRVARATGIELAEMRSRSRARAVARARRVALWAWARELGRWQSEMNGVLGLSSATGCWALQQAAEPERAQARELARELWATLAEAGECVRGA